MALEDTLPIEVFKGAEFLAEPQQDSQEAEELGVCGICRYPGAGGDCIQVF